MTQNCEITMSVNIIIAHRGETLTLSYHVTIFHESQQRREEESDNSLRGFETKCFKIY